PPRVDGARAHLARAPFPTRRSSDLWTMTQVIGPEPAPLPTPISRVAIPTMLRGLIGSLQAGQGKSCTIRHIHRGSCITPPPSRRDRKSTRLNSSHVNISYAVSCFKE